MQPPSSNLDPNVAPWGRWVTQELQAIQRERARQLLDDVNINKQQNSTARLLAEQQAQLLAQQEVLAKQVADVENIVTTLTAASLVQYSEMAEAFNFTGFYNGSRPALKVTTPTGRLEIGYGGSLNGGDGYFLYSIVNADTGIVYADRNVIFNSAPKRVAVTGGASFSPSGYKNVVVTVPPNVPLTVTLELYANNSFVYFVGGSLLVRPTL